MQGADQFRFLHIDAGNIITWGVVAGAWLIARGMDWRGLSDRVRWMERWQEGHEDEAEKRNVLIGELSRTTAVLTKLADIAEKRLERLEGDR